MRLKNLLISCAGIVFFTWASTNFAFGQTAETVSPQQIAEQAKRDAGLYKYKASYLKFVGTTASSIPYAGGGIRATANLNAEVAEKEAARKTALANAMTAQVILENPSLSSKDRRSDIVSRLKSDSGQASILAVVGIERIETALEKRFSDLEGFETELAESKIILSEMKDEIAETSKSIRSGNQEILTKIQEGQVDSLTAYLATRDALINVHSEVQHSARMMIEHEKNMAENFEAASSERKSQVANLLSVGEDTRSAVIRVEQSQNETADLIRRQGSVMNSISATTSITRSASTFNAKHTFAKLPPEERLNILNSPGSDDYVAILGHLQPEAQEAAENEFRSVAIKQQNDINFRSNVETAQAVVGGIQTLGNVFDWEFTKSEDFNEGVQYFNVAAGLALSGGNPMAMISALGGLGGAPSGPSAGEMQILAKLAVMDQKLDDLLRGQEEIKTLIESSFESLNNKQLETLVALDRVGSDVLSLQQQSSSIMRNLIENSDLNSQIEQCGYINTESSGKMVFNYNQASELLKPGLVNRYMNSCQAAIDTLWYAYFSRDGKLSIRKFRGNIAAEADVRLNANGTTKSTVIDLNERVYAPLLDLLWREYGVFIDSNERPKDYKMPFRLILALSDPTVKFDDLRAKPFNAKYDSKTLFRALGDNSTRALAFEDMLYLLDADSINKVTQQFITALPLIYRNLGEGERNGRYILFDDQYISDNRSDEMAVIKKLRSQYRHLLHALNTSIAQQNLLSGDFVIPHVADHVISEKPSELRNRLIIAMQQNSVLSDNVLAYIIDTHLISKRLRPSQTFGSIELKSSDHSVNATENWAHNLFVYDKLVGRKIRSAPQAPRWSYLEEKGQDDQVTCGDELSWTCILPVDFEVENNQLQVCQSSVNDEGKNVKGDCYSFDLPDPAFLDRRQLKLRNQVGELYESREALLAAIELLDETFSLQLPLGADVTNQNIWYSIH